MRIDEIAAALTGSATGNRWLARLMRLSGNSRALEEPGYADR
jgi:hypothetical protein